MKKIYHKPLISVEEMSLNQSIATAVNCTANKDDMEVMKMLGYFLDEAECFFTITEHGKVDSNFDGVLDEHDTLCYHSNAQTIFMS